MSSCKLDRPTVNTKMLHNGIHSSILQNSFGGYSYKQRLRAKKEIIQGNFNPILRPGSRVKTSAEYGHHFSKNCASEIYFNMTSYQDALVCIDVCVFFFFLSFLKNTCAYYSKDNGKLFLRSNHEII